MNGVEIVVATADDYEVAYNVLTGSAPRVLETCSVKARDAFFGKIKPAFIHAGKPLQTGQIVRLLNEPPSTVHRWLSDYVKDGLLVRDGKNIRQHLYLLNSEESEFRTQDLGLVEPSALQAFDWDDLI